MVDSRPGPDTVRRRRVCGECRRRFTTYERVGSPMLKVVKRAGHAESFDTGKLVLMLRRVCRHRPNLDDRDFLRIAHAIEAQLDDRGEKFVRSGEIATLVLDRLAEIDPLSHRRLAASYLDEAGNLRTDARPVAPDEAQQLGLFALDPDANGRG